MSAFGKYDSNGDISLFPQYQMSGAVMPNMIEEDIYRWQKEFWDNVFKFKSEPPMPIMIGKKPYWRGVYPPHGEDEATKVYVADFDLKIYRVNENAVRLPNDAEYDQHFRRVIAAGTYALQKIRKSHQGIILVRKWQPRTMADVHRKKKA